MAVVLILGLDILTKFVFVDLKVGSFLLQL